MLTPTCQYAMRALVCLGNSRPDTPVLARSIAESQHIPAAFLSKILQKLIQHGFVRSQKGPGGGYRLDRPAGQITVREVMVAIDGVEHPEDRCLFGQSECNSLVACPMHDAWTEIKARFDATIGSMTIRELAAHGSGVAFPSWPQYPHPTKVENDQEGNDHDHH